MTGKELKRLRKRMGLSQRQLADLLGVLYVSVSRCERGGRGIGEPTGQLIRLVEEDRRVLEMFKKRYGKNRG